MELNTNTPRGRQPRQTAKPNLAEMDTPSGLSTPTASIFGDDERLARVWEQRASEPVHELHQAGGYGPKGPLTQNAVAPYLDPETGLPWPQKWVRTRLAGEQDTDNVHRHLEEGWRPRPASSCPEGRYLPIVDDRTFGQIIETRGMVLMYMPPRLHQRMKAKISSQTALQEQAVRSDSFRDTGAARQALARDNGIPELEMNVTSRVTVGERPAPVDP